LLNLLPVPVLIGLSSGRVLGAPWPYPAADAKPDDAPDEIVHAMEQAYAGSEFWWKRQQQVEVPWRPLKIVGDVIAKFFTFLGDLIGPVIKAFFYFLRDIWYWVRDLFGFLGFGSDYVTIALSLLLVCLISWIIWKIHPLVWNWLKSGDRGTQSKGSAAPVHEELPEARLLLQQATEMMQQGKYPEAIRFAFLALLAHLQNRGLLRYDRSRTNREYQTDLRNVPDLARVFREATRPYERAWYGRVPVTSAETERMLGICGQLVAQETQG
jgi:hypothetical protein